MKKQSPTVDIELAKADDYDTKSKHTTTSKHLKVKKLERNVSARSGLSKKGITDALKEGILAKFMTKRRNSNASFISGNVAIKGKKKTVKKEKQDTRLKLDFDDSVSMLCKLCNKETPIKFFRNEEAIKNIPI